MAYSFPTIEAGWEAIREVFQAGLRPAVTRLYDPIDSFILKQGSVKGDKPKQHSSGSRKSKRNLGPLARTILKLPKALNAVIEAAEGNLLGGATLILLFEGASEPVQQDTSRARAMLERMDCTSMGEAPARRWLEHRYSVSYRQAPVFRLGAFSDTMEVAAPWSKLGALYDAVRDALGDHVLVMAHLSHAYPDGCSIYFTFSGAAKDDDEAIAKYDEAWRAALKAAIDAGGTLSHHHGVGRSKAPALGQELGYGVTVARDVLRALDPSGVMNPGNLLPREDVPLPQTPIPELGLDEASRTVACDAGIRVSELERDLQGRGFSLDAQPPGDDVTVGSWLAAGAPGARANWADPVRQLCSGLVADMGSERVVIRSAPRRAVGPDLSALFLGARDRIAPITQATLAVRKREQSPARSLPVGFDVDPAVSAQEDAAFERIATTVRKA